MKGSFIEVGRVVGTHGFAGKIRVAPFSGDPSSLLRVPRVRLCGGGEEAAPDSGQDFDLGAAQPLRGCAVLSLEGVTSADRAAPLVGSRVLVRREDLPPAGEGEYYWADLIGCTLVGPGGSILGEVTGLIQGPAHDWLEVMRPDGEALLPFIDAFIREVDTAGRRIVASPPEGW